MGFLKSAMASVGVGSAKIDAILDSEIVRAGGVITGKIRIKAGNIEQKIDKIYVKVITSYTDGEDHPSCTICELKMPVGRTTRPGQEVDVPFRLPLPIDTPVSLKYTSLWVLSGLDIKKAIDPGDRDKLTVGAHPYMDVVLEALYRLNFDIRYARNKACKSKRGFPFVQKFTFVPKDKAMFNNKLDYVEIVFHMYTDGIALLMDIDRKASFLKELTNADNTFRILNISKRELGKGPDHVAKELKNYIKRFI